MEIILLFIVPVFCVICYRDYKKETGYNMYDLDKIHQRIKTIRRVLLDEYGAVGGIDIYNRVEAKRYSFYLRILDRATLKTMNYNIVISYEDLTELKIIDIINKITMYFNMGVNYV